MAIDEYRRGPEKGVFVVSLGLIIRAPDERPERGVSIPLPGEIRVCVPFTLIGGSHHETKAQYLQQLPQQMRTGLGDADEVDLATRAVVLRLRRHHHAGRQVQNSSRASDNSSGSL